MTIYRIGTTNNLLSGGMVDVNSPDDATIICSFLCGFTGSTECTVQYGTDPTYMNLPEVARVCAHIADAVKFLSNQKRQVSVYLAVKKQFLYTSYIL